MSHDNRRAERVAEAIRAEVAPFLAEGGGAKDPRIVALVTVTGVDVTRDLRHAVIHVSVMGSDVERASTLEGLASVAGHLRHRLAGTLRLRVAPEIAFKLDESIAKAARIETLLAQIERDRDTSDSGGATPGPDA